MLGVGLKVEPIVAGDGTLLPGMNGAGLRCGCGCGCRMNVEEGWIFCFVGATFLTGDETGCGMNDGIAPPRLVGGVTKLLAGYTGGTKREEVDRGGVDVMMSSEDENRGLKDVARGIEDGDVMFLMNDACSFTRLSCFSGWVVEAAT